MSHYTAHRRVCTDCHAVELEPDTIGDQCPDCSCEIDRHYTAMRDQAVALEGYTRDRRDHRSGCAGACSAWSGPAPLGGRRAHCRKVGEMREARA